MTMYNMIDTYGKGKGEKVMWESVKIISDAVENHMDEKDKDHLMRKVFHAISGGHYNECFAKEDVTKMYYVDDSGRKHCGPFLTEEKIFSVYDQVKDTIPGYNKWDWYVVMNMIISDYAHLVKRWFQDNSEEQMEKRFIELALNWLHDEDNPYGSEKAWGYFNHQ